MELSSSRRACFWKTSDTEQKDAPTAFRHGVSRKFIALYATSWGQNGAPAQGVRPFFRTKQNTPQNNPKTRPMESSRLLAPLLSVPGVHRGERQRGVPPPRGKAKGGTPPRGSKDQKVETEQALGFSSRPWAVGPANFKCEIQSISDKITQPDLEELACGPI